MLPALLAALLLVAPAPRATQRQTIDIGGHPILVEADRVEVQAAAHRVYLVGRARLQVGEAVFTADEIVLDYTNPNAPAASATGHVVLEDPERGRITGERLRYDLAVKRGELHGVEVTIPLKPRYSLRDLARPSELSHELRITAQEATQVGNQLTFRHAGVTTSPLNPPQFQFLVDRMALTVGGKSKTLHGIQRLDLEGARIQLYGKTLFALPDVDVTENSLLIPHVGTNSTNGFFIEQPFRPFPVRPVKWSITPRLGTNSGLTGMTRIAYDLPLGTVELVASLRERQLRLINPVALQISRMPEVNYHLNDLLIPGPQGRFSGALRYGLINEKHNLQTWRANFAASYDLVLHEGASTRLSAGVAASHSLYGTKQDYSWVRGTLSIEKRFGYTLYLGATTHSHWIRGSTPFLFDQIEVPTDLVLAGRWRVTPHWLVGSDFLLDINHGTLRREHYTLDYRDRLLEYGIGVLARPRLEFDANFRLLGF